MLHQVFGPGFFASPEVRNALVVGGIVAIASAVVGVFTVLRGQSFAGHALADIGTTGGAAAFLICAPPLVGFLIFTLSGAAVMDLIGIRRSRGRDLATGIVLGVSLGLSTLFLYWDTTARNAHGAVTTVLFGSLFTLSPSTVPLVAVFGSICLLGVLVLYRPLLLSGVHPEIAAARGVNVRLVGIGFLAALAIAVGLSAIAIGSTLSTALLIGPAAIAVRFARRPGTAMLIAAALGVAVTWLGVLLSYDSYTWPPVQHGWPVSFLVVALIFTGYLCVELGSTARKVSRTIRRRRANLLTAAVTEAR